MLRLPVVIAVVLAAAVNGSSYGGGGGGYPQQQQPQYGQQQQQPQQQQQQQQQQDSYNNQQQGQGRQQGSPYPPQYGMQSSPSQGQGQYPSNPLPPSYGGGGALTPYGTGRGPPPQEQVGGIFAKFKSSIFAAGQALTGGPDLQGSGSQFNGMQGQNQAPGQRRPLGFPPHASGPGQGPGAFGGRSGPPPPPVGQQTGSPPAYYSPPRPQQYQEEQEGGGGLLGKIKGFFGTDEQQQQQQQQQQPQRPQQIGVRPFAPPPPGMYGQNQGPPRGPPPPQTPPPPPQYNQYQAPLPPQSQSQYGGQGQGQKPPPPPSYPSPPNPFGSIDREPEAGYGQLPSYPFDEPQIIDGPGMTGPLPPPGMQQQGQSQGQSQGYPDNMHSPQDNMFAPPGYPGDMLRGQIQHQEEQRQPAHLSIPSEPQVFVVEDCIVMVLRPQEYFRKKYAFTAAGPGALQVFSDFEHVLTHSKIGGVRTVGSGELLECAQNVFSMNAITQLREVASDFALVEEADMDDAHFEDFTARCQSIVAREGGLHIASVAPATRDLLARLGLKDGWKEALSALAVGGVPTFVFSSGHGDVISQAFLQGGLGGDSGPRTPASQGGQILPQNLRIISNFFRTAPDGSVRAFSQPIVHERNKNATTASRHMGMPVPDRPHALVFGSHEDDLMMTEGAQGLREQLSIGFLELSEDLTQRLPNFLSTFDAVVVGDGSFVFAKSVIEEILQITPAARMSPKAKPSLLERLNNIGGLNPDMGMF